MTWVRRSIFAGLATVVPLLSTKAQATDKYDCHDCARLSSTQMSRALTALDKAPLSRVDVFTFFSANRPVALPLDAVEGGRKCSISDNREIKRLVRMMLELKVSSHGSVGVTSVAEIQFYRFDRPKPVLSLFLPGSLMLDPVIASIVLNGHLGTVHGGSAKKILDYAGDVTDPPGGKMCDIYKDFGD